MFLFSLWTSRACGSLTPSCMQGPHTYVCIKLGYFLLLISLISIIRPAERILRVEESLSLPHNVIFHHTNSFLKIFRCFWHKFLNKRFQCSCVGWCYRYPHLLSHREHTHPSRKAYLFTHPWISILPSSQSPYVQPPRMASPSARSFNSLPNRTNGMPRDILSVP